MKIIYLAAGHANIDLPGHNIVYQDKFIKRDIPGDMLDVDLSNYDILVATPPCNYWSIANYRRDISKYAIETKNLLPLIIDKFIKTNKPFLIENVKNDKLFISNNLFNKKCFIYKIGRHTYWSNIMLNYDFYIDKNIKIQNLSKKQRQGSGGVNEVIKYFLEISCIVNQ